MMGRSHPDSLQLQLKKTSGTMIKGDVWVKSEEGAGSEHLDLFSLVRPCSASKDEWGCEAVRHQGYKLLVQDFSRDNFLQQQ